MVLVVVTMLCVIGAGAQTLTSGDYEYEVSANKSYVTITKYNGTATKVTIPSTIDGKPVHVIGTKAFYGNATLENVVIPDCVTTIDERAFYNCTAIASISIPDNVTKIGDYAFTGCSDLATVNIGKGVTTIGKYAFRSCSSLTTLDIDESVEIIGNYAFANCSSLSSVTFHEGLVRIGERAFAECRLLASVTIPDSVTGIGESAFLNTAFQLNQTTDVIYAGKWIIDCNGYRDGEGLESITIKDGVTHIADDAFSSCLYLKSVDLPDSIRYIGDYTFKYCEALESVTIPDGVTSLGEGTFYGCVSLKKVSLPDTLTTLDEGTFYECEALESIVLPDSITKMGGCTFYCCFSLKSVVLPSKINAIRGFDFFACMALESIDIPDTVRMIDSYAFSECESLTTVKIPDGVTDIGEHAFSYCYTLGYVDIPDSVEKIDIFAFYSCPELYSVTVPENVTTIGNYAFGYYFDEDKGGAALDSNLVLYCRENSVAHTYAVENGVAYLICIDPITGFSVTDRGSDYITLAWDEDTSADAYMVEQYIDGEWVQIAGICDETTYTVTGLAPFTKYSFRMRSYRNTGSLTFFSDYTITRKPVTNPAAVTGFGINASGSDYITLIWNKNTGVTGYSIEQYKDGAWTEIATITSDKTTSYKVTGLAASTKYSFRMRAYGITEMGNKVCGDYTATLITITLMPATSGFTSPSKSTTAVRLSWTADALATGYVIERYVSGNWVQIADITDGTATTYKVTGLLPGTAYSFRMFTYSDENSGDYTEELTVNTMMTEVKNFASPSKSTSAIRLSWTENKYADGYVIEQYKSGSWVQIADITDSATVTYKVTGLKTGTAYKFRMKAYSVTKYGETIYGNKTATLTANTLAPSVTGLDLKSRSSIALRLTWEENTAVDGYAIEQYKSGKWVQIADISDNTVIEYKVTGLKSATTYKFRMRGYCITKYGDKAYSAYTSTLKKTTAPSAVTELTVKSRAKTAIRLAWKQVTSAKGYIIEQYKDGKWVRVGKVTPNDITDYRIDGLASGTTYKFRVKTYIVTDTSIYSNYAYINGTTL